MRFRKAPLVRARTRVPPPPPPLAPSSRGVTRACWRQRVTPARSDAAAASAAAAAATAAAALGASFAACRPAGLVGAAASEVPAVSASGASAGTTGGADSAVAGAGAAADTCPMLPADCALSFFVQPRMSSQRMSAGARPRGRCRRPLSAADCFCFFRRAAQYAASFLPGISGVRQRGLQICEARSLVLRLSTSVGAAQCAPRAFDSRCFLEMFRTQVTNRETR